MSKHLKATARVLITIEVTPSDCWGADCAFDQLRKQAADVAINLVRRVIEGNTRCRIVGEPEVVAVLVEDPTR